MNKEIVMGTKYTRSRNSANILLKLLVKLGDSPIIVDSSGIDLKNIQELIYEKQKYVGKKYIRYSFQWNDEKEQLAIEPKFWKEVKELIKMGLLKRENKDHVSITIAGALMDRRIEIRDKNAREWISCF